jgi:phosphohistidine phosphatase
VSVASRICLIRHAEAVDQRSDLPDGARYLTAAGRQAAANVGLKLSKYFSSAPSLLPRDAIRMVASPLVRAMQTAELLAAGFGPDLVVECEPLLAPGADLAALVARLQQAAATDLLFVVGHEPDLALLGAALSNGGDFPDLARTQAALIEGSMLRWGWMPADAAPSKVAS